MGPKVPIILVTGVICLGIGAGAAVGTMLLLGYSPERRPVPSIQPGGGMQAMMEGKGGGGKGKGKKEGASADPKKGAGPGMPMGMYQQFTKDGMPGGKGKGAGGPRTQLGSP